MFRMLNPGGWSLGSTLVATFVAVPTTLLLTATPAAAISEVHAYGISEYGDSPYCGPGFSDHSVHLETLDSFLETFRDLQDEGDWDQITELHNTQVHGSYFTDDSKEDDCKCSDYQPDCSCIGADDGTNLGADDADVIFVHTHGYSNRGSDTPSRTGIVAGNINTDCTPTTEHNMQWNGDLDIAVIKACQAGSYEVATAGGFWHMVDSDSQFRMWNSFHGNSSCGNHVKRYVKRYAEDSIYNGVGENWLDEAYDWDWGSNNDDCPTSIVFGYNLHQCTLMYENGGWKDRKDTGSRVECWIWYVGGCDPAGGMELPD